MDYALEFVRKLLGRKGVKAYLHETTQVTPMLLVSTVKVSLALEEVCKVRYNRLLGCREFGYPLYVNGSFKEQLLST